MKYIKGKKYIGSLKCTRTLLSGAFKMGNFYDCYEEDCNTVWVVRSESSGLRFYYGRIPLLTNNLRIFIDFFDIVPLERKLKLKRINDNIREIY